MSLATEPGARTYRYYDLILAAFVAAMIGANFIAAPKVVQVHALGRDWVFGAGVLIFPITYLVGDVVTEVYGYARSRRVVWAGFGALAFASLVSWAVIALPASPSWPNQAAWRTVFGNSPRVVAASMVAFLAGEFVNAYVLAKLKIRTRGRWLWLRTIGSTVVGEGVDSLIFYPAAFLGDWETRLLVDVLVMQYVLKVAWEVVATPLTYAVVGSLKRAEAADFYDTRTDFTPFSIRAE